MSAQYPNETTAAQYPASSVSAHPGVGEGVGGVGVGVGGVGVGTGLGGPGGAAPLTVGYEGSEAIPHLLLPRSIRTYPETPQLDPHEFFTFQ